MFYKFDIFYEFKIKDDFYATQQVFYKLIFFIFIITAQVLQYINILKCTLATVIKSIYISFLHKERKSI